MSGRVIEHDTKIETHVGRFGAISPEGVGPQRPGSFEPLQKDSGNVSVLNPEYVDRSDLRTQLHFEGQTLPPPLSSMGPGLGFHVNVSKSVQEASHCSIVEESSW